MANQTHEAARARMAAPQQTAGRPANQERTKRARGRGFARGHAKRFFVLVSLAFVLISCSEAAEPSLSQGSGESTTVTPENEPPASSITSTTVESATSTTDAARPESNWPGEPPSRYAVFEDGRLSVVEGADRYEISDLSEPPTAGGFVGDSLVFSVGCCDGIWVWDYDESDTADPVVSEGDHEHITLNGVASDWEQPGFFYTTGSGQPADVPDLMFYHLADKTTHRFLDMGERLAGLSEEEQNASVGTAVATEDLVGLVFAFGDGTWVEWYTDTAEPAESPFAGISQDGTVLELALAPAGDSLVVGREEQLHQGITTVDVVDPDGARSYSVPDVQSLRHLQFDGRYVTASTHRNDLADSPDSPSARLILDVERGHFDYATRPPILALGE